MTVDHRTAALPSGLFHPAVAAWFEEELGRPTAPQVRAWPSIKAGRPTLIAAPTGSGKTLAAFLSIIDDLVVQSLRDGELPREVQAVYVSPLKALSNDIDRNLELPLAGIRRQLALGGFEDVDIHTAVRTGDTTPSARARMLRKPPHILVTTPESLYILLTSEGGRKMLSSTRTVIVDEIHAMVADKRGTHLSLTLERLQRLVESNGSSTKTVAGRKNSHRRPLRIGLSATQKPIEKVADFLFGDEERTIIDLGHQRKLDLQIEVPQSPLEAVMSNEVWEEIYDRLAELIEEHSTTLLFSNTRRQTERIARHLSERLGKDVVTSHHGSLSKEHRLDAERRLKNGELKALIATAALELGIDIGSVDLVCQIGSTRSISALLQRVGRSGHQVDAVPKGRLFPLSRDELVEAVAALDAIRSGELDRLIIPEQSIDILAQQIVAAVACEEWDEKELYDFIRGSFPYRNLSYAAFEDVIGMLRDGFSTRRGRRGAYLHHDRIGGRLRARRGARLAALTNGGAIPNNANYDVILEPGEVRVGSVDEDFAIESLPGNIFQLGNTSWRILKIEPGKVRVADARGQPPTIPFWFGEAPARSAELSAAVTRLRTGIVERAERSRSEALSWLTGEHNLRADSAEQLVDYLAATAKTLGAMPSQTCLVLERFFDEAGSMHVVLHSPFGSRLNRAWGLALRKRFCRKFNFELQAAATEDAIVLSLGLTHSFDLKEVFHYLHPDTVRDLLIQAMLDAPMFNVRWRWNAGRALAILRFRSGRKVPPPIQRMNADDLISVVFPDQLACFENIQGEREIPDHPLVAQTIRDCLEEAMDIDRLEALLRDIHSGKIELIARDLTEPSPLAQEILNARPYAFLDDAPLEERRTQAVINRRWLDPETASDLGALDSDAIDLVRREAAPDPENADELHDALVLSGFLTDGEIESAWSGFLDELVQDGRLTHVVGAGNVETRNNGDNERGLWVAAERLSEMLSFLPTSSCSPELELPEALRGGATGPDALREILRGRLELLGPVTEEDLAKPLLELASLGEPPRNTADEDSLVSTLGIRSALAALESEGFVLKGRFSPGATVTEWCERRLLARIHRRTLRRLRRSIEPVPTAAFLRFLMQWQHLEEGEHKGGPLGLEEVVHLLEGFELPAGSWEEDVLPMRIEDYEPAWLDALCLAGKAQWRRRSLPAARTSSTKASRTGPIRSTPITLVRRQNRPLWQHLRDLRDPRDPQPRRQSGDDAGSARVAAPSPAAQRVLDYLQHNGASFFDEIAVGIQLLHTQLEPCMAELAAQGLVTSDSFLGLRAMLVPANKKKSTGRPASRRRTVDFGLDDAGRWSSLVLPETPPERLSDDDLESLAWILLRRWGVVFRRLLDRETGLPPWRELLRVLRRLEARGEIRGGRFVNRFSGEQFALPEAIPALRKKRKAPEEPIWISVSAADPINLVGILTPGARVPSLSGNRILFRDGCPIAHLTAGEVHFVEDLEPGARWEAEKRLRRKLMAEAEDEPREDEPAVLAASRPSDLRQSS